MIISRNGIKYTTVVMDGTSEDVVLDIMAWIDDITEQEFGKSTCRPLDDKHQTMIVIETRTKESRYDLIRCIIELRYPGLCIFNPPM